MRYLASLALALLVAAPSFAQFKQPDTLVAGNVQIDVKAEDVTTEASFLGAAETDIGTINDGAYVFGNVDIKADVGKVTTKGAFLGKACTSIGSIGGCKNQSGGLF
jgi:hypothetical protein